MAEIIDGEFVRNKTNENSRGGTEILTEELSKRIDKELLKEFHIVSSRVKSKLSEDKIRIFWAHDLPGDPESKFLKDKNRQEQFHKFVFVSNWQMQAYLQSFGIPWEKCVVMKNAIEGIEPHEKPSIDDGINLIYTPTPHRGLQILVPVFERLCKEHDNLTLNVFSSFELYGWKERDQQYKDIFDKMDAHPNIVNHGTVDNSVVRDYLKKSHIFAYPSIWPETSCMCLMEAMSAGLVCVHSNYAALYETAANWTHMYQLQEEASKHAGIFYSLLNAVIQNYQSAHIQTRLGPMQAYANIFYTWPQRINEWNSFLTSLRDQIKDRSMPKEKFHYSTV